MNGTSPVVVQTTTFVDVIGSFLNTTFMCFLTFQILVFIIALVCFFKKKNLDFLVKFTFLVNCAFFLFGLGYSSSMMAREFAFVGYVVNDAVLSCIAIGFEEFFLRFAYTGFLSCMGMTLTILIFVLNSARTTNKN